MASATARLKLLPALTAASLALTGLPTALAQSAPVPTASQPVAESPDYRLSARDSVRVSIVDEVEGTVTQRISAAGEITVPMLGTVKVGGKTLREANDMLAKAYIAHGYFINPQVIITIEAYASRTVQVLGQVNKPDDIPFQLERTEMGIVQAIAQAGGFTRAARADAVRVIRNINGRDEQFVINVAAYLEGKDSSNEFRILPGDIIFVPERVF